MRAFWAHVFGPSGGPRSVVAALGVVEWWATLRRGRPSSGNGHDTARPASITVSLRPKATLGMFAVCSVLHWIDKELQRLALQGLLRSRRIRTGPQGACCKIEGKRVINFGSNDYLGLAGDHRLAAAARAALRREGTGSGASPLVSGYSRYHRLLERKLAAFEATEAALVCVSGYAANVGTVAALVGPGDLVLSDAHNHASLLDGCRLSRADVRVYPHCDMAALERLLRRSHRYRRCLIVTDTLFSMDGDFAPLPELADLADLYQAMLLVDEAHATGVFGQHGRGLVEFFGLEDRVPVRVGTLSKALGCAGGFVVGSQVLVDWLVNRARTYIFSTAMPPPIAAAAAAAISIVRSEPQRRYQLLQRAELLREQLRRMGWDIGRSASQIIPLVVGTPQRATVLAAQLFLRGVFVPAIRPPAVPEGQSCLRISLTAAHSDDHIAQLIDALAAAG